jgi:AcrR family transcriptional regulator
MTEGGGAAARHAGGRRSGPSKTRAAILAAARRLFASEGADRTTIRAVAQEAGVDPALVLHYFGSKDGLFVAAIEWPMDMSVATERIFAGGADGLGERITRFFMEQWEREETRHQLEIIVRRAVSREPDAKLLNEFAHNQLIGRLVAAFPGPDIERRGGLVLSTLVGLALVRYVLKVEPLASMGHDEVATIVGATIQRYVSGDLAPDASGGTTI